MIILKTAARSLSRNLTRSTSTVLVIAAMAGFLVLYGQNMARSRSEMEATSATIPVYADINALKGKEDPLIPASTLDAIEQTGFVRASALKAQLFYNLKRQPPMEKAKLWAVNDQNADRQLKKHLEAMTWAEGWNLERFLSSTEPVVILPQGSEAEPGQQLEISVRPSIKVSGVKVSVSVIAVYNDELDDEDWLNRHDGKTFAFCPLPWLRQQMAAGLIDQEQVVYHYARLQLQDVVHINDFKKQMVELGFNSEESGLQMVITDRLLLSAINPLMKSVSLQQKLYPLLFGLIALLGASLCWLTMNARKQEMAIMRSMGVTPGTVFVSFLSETLLLCLVGTAIGSLLLLTGAEGFDLWLLPLFVLCYLAGGAIAIKMLDRDDVLALLQSRNE